MSSGGLYLDGGGWISGASDLYMPSSLTWDRIRCLPVVLGLPGVLGLLAAIGVAGDDGSHMVAYEPMHGFESEERRVVFAAGGLVWDAQLRETLAWRREGEEDEEWTRTIF